MRGDEATCRQRLDLELVAEPTKHAFGIQVIEIPSPNPAALVLDLVPLPAITAIDPELKSVAGGARGLRLLLCETDHEVQERELVPRVLVGLADLRAEPAAHHRRRLLS